MKRHQRWTWYPARGTYPEAWSQQVPLELGAQSTHLYRLHLIRDIEAP